MLCYCYTFFIIVILTLFSLKKFYKHNPKVLSYLMKNDLSRRSLGAASLRERRPFCCEK